MSRRIRFIKYAGIVVNFLSIFLVCQTGWAQDTIFDNDGEINHWQNRLQEPTTRDKGNYYTPGEDFPAETEGEYITPEEYRLLVAPPSSEITDEKLAEDMSDEERVVLPDADQITAYYLANVSYGLATGFLFGGWAAIADNSDAGNSLRYIGTGLLLGAMAGFVVSYLTVDRLVAVHPNQTSNENKINNSQSLLENFDDNHTKAVLKQSRPYNNQLAVSLWALNF